MQVTQLLTLSTVRGSLLGRISAHPLPPHLVVMAKPFSFGAPAPAAFSFGAPAPAAPAAGFGGFSFGAAPAAPAPAPFAGFGAPAAPAAAASPAAPLFGGFSFGAPAAAAPPAAAPAPSAFGGFGFGLAAPAAAAATAAPPPAAPAAAVPSDPQDALVAQALGVLFKYSLLDSGPLDVRSLLQQYYKAEPRGYKFKVRRRSSRRASLRVAPGVNVQMLDVTQSPRRYYLTRVPAALDPSGFSPRLPYHYPRLRRRCLLGLDVPAGGSPQYSRYHRRIPEAAAAVTGGVEPGVCGQRGRRGVRAAAAPDTRRARRL